MRSNKMMMNKYILKKRWIRQTLLVRKDMDVNEHERLSYITVRQQIKQNNIPVRDTFASSALMLPATIPNL